MNLDSWNLQSWKLESSRWCPVILYFPRSACWLPVGWPWFLPWSLHVDRWVFRDIYILKLLNYFTGGVQILVFLEVRRFSTKVEEGTRINATITWKDHLDGLLLPKKNKTQLEEMMIDMYTLLPLLRTQKIFCGWWLKNLIELEEWQSWRLIRK